MGKIKLLGVISDVHNDANALVKALQILKDCDKIIHLGDIVDDSEEANTIVELLIRKSVEGVKGYHDDTAFKVSHVFNEQTKNYLSNLPLEIKRGDFLFVHDNPLSKEKNKGLWNYGGYIKDEYTAKMVFEESEQKVLFVGHTHKAQQYEFDGQNIRKITEDVVQLNPKNRYILNPGPVCLQDRGTAPSVGIFDFKNNRFIIKKI